MSSCLVVQHVAAEGPALIAERLVASDVEVVVWRVDRDGEPPRRTNGYDGLVVMGGPMSARDDTGFPTRRLELALLSDALERGIPTLGICLGAQLLAAAAGGRVVSGGSGPEIGWAPVRLSSLAGDDPLLGDAPGVLRALHWHGDTYTLPPGAVHLASSAVYDQQAFRVGTRAWGLQFHLEVDEGTVSDFVSAFADELSAAGIDPTTITDATADALRVLAPHRLAILTRFARLVAVGRASGSTISAQLVDRT